MSNKKMTDEEALDYMLSSGLPICEAIKTITQAPPEQIPKLLGTYIRTMAETIEPGGINNLKLVKYLTGSTGAIVGLMNAGRAVRKAEE